MVPKQNIIVYNKDKIKKITAKNNENYSKKAMIKGDSKEAIMKNGQKKKEKKKKRKK